MITAYWYTVTPDNKAIFLFETLEEAREHAANMAAVRKIPSRDLVGGHIRGEDVPIIAQKKGYQVIDCTI